MSSFVRFVLYPILWRLIQFRGETANWAPPFNGRRAREAGPFAAKKMVGQIYLVGWPLALGYSFETGTVRQ